MQRSQRRTRWLDSCRHSIQVGGATESGATRRCSTGHTLQTGSVSNQCQASAFLAGIAFITFQLGDHCRGGCDSCRLGRHGTFLSNRSHGTITISVAIEWNRTGCRGDLCHWFGFRGSSRGLIRILVLFLGQLVNRVSPSGLLAMLLAGRGASADPRE